MSRVVGPPLDNNISGRKNATVYTALIKLYGKYGYGHENITFKFSKFIIDEFTCHAKLV
jgi:hypothetical protein